MPTGKNAPQGKMPTGKNAHREKCPQGKMPTGKNAHKENCPQGKLPTGKNAHREKCPQGKMPTGKNAHKEKCPQGKMPTGKNVHREKCPQGKMSTGKNAHMYNSLKIVTGMSVFVKNGAMRKGILRNYEVKKVEKYYLNNDWRNKEIWKSEQWNEDTTKSIMHAQIISLSVEGFYSC